MIHIIYIPCPCYRCERVTQLVRGKEREVVVVDGVVQLVVRMVGKHIFDSDGG